MGWRTVVVTQHAKISLTLGNLLIQTDTGINHVHVKDIQVLIVSSLQVVITSAAICELSKNNAKIIFSDNSNQPISEVINYTRNISNVSLLKKQFDWTSNNLVSKKLWTKIVISKISNQIQALDFFGINSDSIISELDKIELDDITNREAVAARKYFLLLFGNDFSRDEVSPINDALNYGYSIILSSVNLQITAYGQLTQLGIHHHSDENYFNLGSDLMEPFRPVVDQWVGNQKFKELTPDVKFSLIRLLDVEVTYNHQEIILRNAIYEHVRNCLDYLNLKKDSIKIEVGIPSEVSNNAFNDNV
ncbi:type II CRISPR-associated endonuclease Cas1 [Lactobacillus sp. Sy-1]|uniref:type II CRISPR-associated endonuclease Cas1 n=1 Tax=Lactobacillus sp. Sy-1 TaxID=2109645 RepID=UPI001C5AE3B9|nr:type II CRISPR-associated endonuclease Cas1 [Lactobacillus sp. Sy-1]MBW1606362.1 type II CRISPR-associated endonuclease Cas1 [Lactobacillus sp. Sy-1]